MHIARRQCRSSLAKLRRTRDSSTTKSGKAYFQVITFIDAGEEVVAMRKTVFQRIPPISLADICEKLKQSAAKIVLADEVEITPNIKRRVASIFADRELCDGHHQGFVRALFPIAHDTLNLPAKFSMEDPCLALVPVTQDEILAVAKEEAERTREAESGMKEEKADSDDGEASSAKAGATTRGAKQVWSLTRAMAKEVAEFNEFLQDGFASDAFFHTMKNNPLLASELCEHWSATFLALDAEPPTHMAAAVENIQTFCLAYQCVMSTGSPITKERHAAFTSVFLTPKTKNVWLQTLVAGARACPDWNAMEMTALSSASFEMRHGSRFLALQESLQSEPLVQATACDILSFCADAQGRVRPALVEDMLKKAIDFAVADIARLTSSSQVSGEAKCLALQAYTTLLAHFSKLEQFGGVIASATKDAQQCAGKISAIINSDALLQMDGNLQETETKAFEEMVLTLVGHDKANEEMKDLLGSMLDHLNSAIGRLLRGDINADVAQLMANRKALLTAGSSLEYFKAAYPHSDAEDFISKARVFARDASNHQETSRSTSFASLVKSGNELKKVIEAVARRSANSGGPVAEENDFGAILRASVEEVLADAFDAMAKATDTKVASAVLRLQAVVDTAKLIAGGAKDGTVWKSMLKGTESLKEVLAVAHAPGGLCKGPGPKVMEIKNGVREAIQMFKRDIGKMKSLTDPTIKAVLSEAEDVITLSQVTVFESQLARSLNKSTVEERKAGCKKYIALYASVDSDEVNKTLMKAATKAIQL